MALFGETFTAEEARCVGIVDQVVPASAGGEAAEKLVARLLSRGGRATELVKLMLAVAEGEETERVVEALAGEIAAESSDLAEGLSAFREKRQPRFR